jgi:hypothetical protein
MQIIQFPGNPKPPVQPGPALSPCLSKKALLKAVRATCANQADAIFVLIEAHRSAFHQWSDAVDVEAHMDSHDPLYRAAAAETERRAEIKWSLLEDIFSITLTTIDGAAAFAAYCQELRDLCGNELEEDHLFAALEKISQVLKKSSPPK